MGRSRSRSRSRGRRYRSPSTSDRSRSRSASPEGYRVHVADLGLDPSKREIEKHFEVYGPLIEVWVAKNPPCFAFVVYKYKDDADMAIREMDGKVLSSGRIKCTFARPRTKNRRRKGFDPNLRCYQCGDRGHFSRDCDEIWRQRQRNRERYRSQLSRSRSRSRDRRRKSRDRSRSQSRSRRNRQRTASKSPRRTRDSRSRERNGDAKKPSGSARRSTSARRDRSPATRKDKADHEDD